MPTGIRLSPGMGWPEKTIIALAIAAITTTSAFAMTKNHRQEIIQRHETAVQEEKIQQTVISLFELVTSEFDSDDTDNPDIVRLMDDLVHSNTIYSAAESAYDILYIKECDEMRALGYRKTDRGTWAPSHDGFSRANLRDIHLESAEKYRAIQDSLVTEYDLLLDE